MSDLQQVNYIPNQVELYRVSGRRGEGEGASVNNGQSPERKYHLYNKRTAIRTIQLLRSECNAF